jgi:bifunctional UDP-N-acetylglucosamine pyrophosphorylase/glucosamine-1-phosphate N-acetyltransferase
MGANDRKGLALINETARARVIGELLTQGADIPFPGQVVAGPEVVVGANTRLLPGTILKGKTIIGEGCEIGPNSVLTDAVLGDDCKVSSSHIQSSSLGNGVTVGPMSNIRPGCVIGHNVKIGNFVDLKNAAVGDGASLAHLTYVGDSEVGRNCNIGCGVVTVNYDGKNKHKTVISDGAFIGCNVNLVAPVKIGEGAFCAAGTTVTEDVPKEALVIGRCRQTVKEGFNQNGKRYSR